MRRFVGALVFLLALHGSVSSENEDSALRGNGKAQENHIQVKELVMEVENLKAKAFVQDKGIDTDILLNRDIGLQVVDDDEEDRVLFEQADAREVASTSEAFDTDEEKTVEKTETLDGKANGRMTEGKVKPKTTENVSDEESAHGQEKRSGVNVENEKAVTKINRDVVFGQTSQGLLLAKHNKQKQSQRSSRKGAK
jgi:hypothetical protein